MRANRVLLLLLWFWACATAAQDYPARQVRVLVGYPPGGGMDTIARGVMPKLAESRAQPFVIENRPGASGGVAAEALVKSAPAKIGRASCRERVSPYV